MSESAARLVVLDEAAEQIKQSLAKIKEAGLTDYQREPLQRLTELRELEMLYSHHPLMPVVAGRRVGKSMMMERMLNELAAKSRRSRQPHADTRTKKRHQLKGLRP